jgi:hypothetical protein
VPWSEKSIMSQRHEFVMLFEQEGVNRRELCRRFGVSPTIGYRLLARWRTDGKVGLADRSRRPQHSPGRSSAAMEGLVLTVRDAHPAWGWAQDPSPVAGSEAPGGAERQHDYCDPASPWSHRGSGERRPQTV